MGPVLSIKRFLLGKMVSEIKRKREKQEKKDNILEDGCVGYSIINLWFLLGNIPREGENERIERGRESEREKEREYNEKYYQYTIIVRKKNEE